MYRLREGIPGPAVHWLAGHAGRHRDGLGRGDRCRGQHRLQANPWMFVLDPRCQQRQRILQAIMPAADDSRRVGAGLWVPGLQQPPQQAGLDNLERRAAAQCLVEVMLVIRQRRIQGPGPGVDRPDDADRIPDGQCPFCLVSCPAFRRHEGIKDLAKRCPQEVGRPGGWFRPGDSPDSAMGLVPGGIPVGIVLVAGDRVVPVDDIDCPVGPYFHVHGTKVPMARLQDGLFPVQGKPGTIVREGKTFYPVSFEISHDKVALHRIRQVPAIEQADSTVSSWIPDPAEL